ncbi:MAG: MBOAT family O-acyltransferase [Geminicoccaceae bacterium]
MTLARYLSVRLGRLSGPTAGFRVLTRPFGANTFQRFWQLWNPIVGYYLLVFVYTPARRILPRPMALAFTFGVSGFVHDAVIFMPIWAAAGKVAFPTVTVAFLVISFIVSVSEAVHLDLRRLPPVGRAIVHLAVIGLSVAISLFLGRSFTESIHPGFSG